MSTYQSTLPQVFPFSYIMPKNECIRCVDELMGHRSSFAVTVEPSDEYLHLWLSSVSNYFLIEQGLISS